MKILRIKETCLYVADLDRTVAFYKGKLGLEHFSLVKDRHAFFRAGQSVLLCFIPEVTRKDERLPPHFGSGKLHLAFEVSRDAYQDWKAKVAAAGIPILHEEKWPGDMFSFYFEDPDGHVLEIIEEGLWGD
ncbi:MAG: VOC family protein [Bacteroidota bacterium]